MHVNNPSVSGGLQLGPRSVGEGWSGEVGCSAGSVGTSRAQGVLESAPHPGSVTLPPSTPSARTDPLCRSDRYERFLDAGAFLAGAVGIAVGGALGFGIAGPAGAVVGGVVGQGFGGFVGSMCDDRQDGKPINWGDAASSAAFGILGGAVS